MSILFNPKTYDPESYDAKTKALLKATIEFFEHKGKRKLKEDDRNRVWYADFLEFMKEHKLFAAFLTPAGYGADDSRWDTWRNCALNEILGFYGLHYWYTWQVSILGLGPIWMTKNEAMKKLAAQQLIDGEVFAFGLSERKHGADIYSTEMSLSPAADGTYLANGEKYYIGNGNVAKMVSTFGKMSDSGEYVFFVADYLQNQYECVQNVINSQSYVSEYVLRDYPVTDNEVLHKGDEAWDAALNTVNIGKYNLGWASIGIATHAFYEALNHASHRQLYGMFVTDFSHVKRMFVDAYSRLVAMKLFARRTSDYLRVASPEDRRYLLYNPVMKMKVTTQGEEVVNLLWDVIAARGFEKDMYFEMATRDIRALPKLEGTVHVNIALIIKFMLNYFMNHENYPQVAAQTEARNDDFLFDQGRARGLSKIRFHDFAPAYAAWETPNVKVFMEQIEAFKRFLLGTPPDKAQQRDVDFLLAMGEIFTLIVYGQLILERAKMEDLSVDEVDQIADFMVRDFSGFALQIHGKASTTEAQAKLALTMIKRPAVDNDRFKRVWTDHVHAKKDAYEMSP